MHSTPQWELILDLMAHLLDPKTLATASCVSKSWRSLLTSNHLWLPLCLSHYPSLTLTLTTTTSSSSSSSSSSISPRRLFALLRTSSSRLRLTPCVPRISLGSLIFSIDIFQEQHTTPVLSMVRFGEDLSMNGGYRVFRFEVEVGEEERRRGVVEEEEEEGEVRVVWNVVMKGWGGAFLMMDRVGRGKKRVVSSGGEEEEEMWFSEELPGPACCSRAAVGAGGGGLVAELVLGLGLDAGDQGGGRRRRKKVERVSLGLMSGVEWRYLSVDDALIYLQPFLLT